MMSKGPFDPSRKHSIAFWVGMGLIAALFLISQYNYLLFHGLAELFSISVAWAVFMLVWSSRAFVTDKALVMLGIAYRKFQMT